MNAKTEGTIAIVAALLVLLSAMWNPRISVAMIKGHMHITNSMADFFECRVM